MKSAIVTGASSGIGKDITKSLLRLGYRVYGIGRNFDKCDIENEFFHKIEINLAKDDIKKIKKEIKEPIYILVNSAGFGEFKPLEEMSMATITNMINTNLTAPIILSNLFLRDLKNTKGYIFNITSIEALKHSKFSALYTATKSGLRNFGLSLFEEVRKSGVKVVTINPDITKTDFFNELNFTHGTNPLSYIEPSCIAKGVEDILNLRDGTIITEITIRSQLLQIEKKKVL